MGFELDRRHVVVYFLAPSVIDQVDVVDRYPFSARRLATAVAADGSQQTKQQTDQFAGSVSFVAPSPYTTTDQTDDTDKQQHVCQ